ncbi:hypothetical protein [Polaribacter sp. Hel1_85]|uniref:hypothetical protein n=1 Tax=Polaribacter sp. Hel1_85 TaxID=1250005 RepID=UPI00052CB6D8|nr:hypothetical protein [Polaribacter sp. Hel1_85]KGL63819.1 hypothetical protein PHEL85_0860 [Polaribacter sp. Hel1_85]
MKIFKLTVFTLILTATTAFTQIGNPNISDNWTLSEFTETLVENNNNETFLVKELEITKEYTPVILDPKDKYKLNQDIIYLPTQVTKSLKLDYDKDKQYEKEAEFFYKKPDNFNLDFTLTKSGVIIKTDKKDVNVSKIWNKSTKLMFSNKRNNRIKQEGNYIIEFTNNEKVDITITNYEIF